MTIFELCFTHNISIPHSLNEYADTISRFVDHDDWGLHPSLFHYLNSIWGPHSCSGLFVSPHNQKLE